MIITTARLIFDKNKSFVKAYAVGTDTGAKFRIGTSGWTPGTQQMYAFGQFGADIIKARVAKGIGSDDAPMPQLKAKYPGRGYPALKQRRGLKPIRDLTGIGSGGHMLDAMTVRYADESTARIDITQQLARQKASNNERLAPWFGWSPADCAKLQFYGRNIFGSFKEEILYRDRSAKLPPGKFADAAQRAA